MKVRSYIIVLTSGSLLGAIAITIFGWFTFSGLRDATNELEREAKNSGSSSEEFSDVEAFLTTTREIFTTMEIYPRDFSGIFNVAYDSITLAKEGINVLSDKHFSTYTDTLLSAISRDIRMLEESIRYIELHRPTSKEDEVWHKRNARWSAFLAY